MLILSRICVRCIRKNVINTSVRSVYEQYRKGDKKYIVPQEPGLKPKIERVKHGLSLLKEEIQLWTEEVKEKLTCDPKIFMPGDTEIVWTFNSEENLKKWITTSDRDNKEGHSYCNFELSKNKKGLFSGYIDKTLPKDGVTAKTGYCNITAMKAKKSFQRDSFLDWTMFTHLVLRVRGDGRPYMINLLTSGYYDVQWHDMYNFVLYTRGGPYWQIAKLPFSRFFLSSKGRVQDKQCRVPQGSITSLGITSSASKSGEFRLEIDYIGIHFDPQHEELFAYEMYQTPTGVVF